MASYNGERFIGKQIESILAQLSSDDELIISDDGSTDSTLDIISAFKDDRIKVVKHLEKRKNVKIKEGRGFYYVTDNFVNALQYAKGDYIFLSDQDDIWLPGKVEKCIKLLQNYDVITHNYQVIDENGILLENKMFDKSPFHKTWIMNIMDSHFRGCCMAFNSKYLKYILPVPSAVIGHDYWIGLLVMKFGKWYYDIEPYIQYRRIGNSVSAERKTSIHYKVLYRYYLFIELMKRNIKISFLNKGEL